MGNRRLIVGLGNPGSEYQMTRHNIGFLVVEDFAQKFGLQWKSEARFMGRVTKGLVHGEEVILLCPTTYMNASGQALRKVKDYFQVEQEKLLVIVDDIALPFGTMRLRAQGSAGGHNGLKSVQAHLGNPHYARLRVGVGNERKGSLTQHVLGRFSKDERANLPTFVGKASDFLEEWLTTDLHLLMGRVNEGSRDRVKKVKEPSKAFEKKPSKAPQPGDAKNNES